MGNYIEEEVCKAFNDVKKHSGLTLSPFLLFDSLGIDFMKNRSKDCPWVVAEQNVIQQWQNMLRLIAGSVQTN